MQLPEGVERARTPERADLVVMPGDTDVEASTVEAWLDAGVGVGLVGERAEATWRRFKQSEAHVHTIGPRGTIELEEDPRTIVAFVRGESVRTYR